MDRTSRTSSRSSAASSWRANAMPSHLRHAAGSFRNARGQALSYVALFPPTTTTTKAASSESSSSSTNGTNGTNGSKNTTATTSQPSQTPPPLPLRGVVVYVHGLGVHARRYYHVYEQLCEAGFGAVAYDLLGHGESDSGRHGMRAHAEKFRYFVDDTNEFVAFVKRSVLPEMLGRPREKHTARGVADAVRGHPERDPVRDEAPEAEDTHSGDADDPAPTTTHSLPIVLMGSSYGSLIAMHTLLSEQHAFAGVVLVSPAISVEWRPILRLQALVVRPMSLVLPTVRAVPAARPELIWRDPAFLEDYCNDPLTVADKMTLRMGAQSLKACSALKREKRFTEPSSAVCALPVLFMMGSADKVTSLSLAVEFFDKMRNADKQFKVFDGMFHALFDDPEKDEVFAFLAQWLTSRFPDPRAPSLSLSSSLSSSSLSNRQQTSQVTDSQASEDSERIRH